MKSSENHIFVTLVFKMSFFSSISEFLVWRQVSLFSKHWFSIFCYHTMLPKHNTINKRWLLPHLSRYLIFHPSSLIDVALSQGSSALHRSRTPLDQAMRPLHHPQVGEAVEPRVQSLCHGGCVVRPSQFHSLNPPEVHNPFHTNFVSSAKELNNIYLVTVLKLHELKKMRKVACMVLFCF